MTPPDYNAAGKRLPSPKGERAWFRAAYASLMEYRGARARS